MLISIQKRLYVFNRNKTQLNDLEFHWVYQGKYILFEIAVKIDNYTFILRINALITSIQCLKMMLNNIRKIWIKTFLLTLHERL